jgi:mevalonate kinase
MNSSTVLATGTAPGKAILLGEHAAVYGRSAIAIPLGGVESRATVELSDGPLAIEAGDLGLLVTLEEAVGTAAEPVATAVEAALRFSGRGDEPWRISITSTVPRGAGLGSSTTMSRSWLWTPSTWRTAGRPGSTPP